jgi:hypothetical protein
LKFPLISSASNGLVPEEYIADVWGGSNMICITHTFIYLEEMPQFPKVFLPMEEQHIINSRNFIFKIYHYTDSYIEAFTAATRVSKMCNN